MSGSVAPALSGLVAAAVCSIQYLNSNSPFSWRRCRFVALLRCAVDGAGGVGAYFIAVKLLHISGTSWWWAIGLTAPALLRSYLTTWQSAAGNSSIDVGPVLVYDLLARAIDGIVDNSQGRDISRWLGNQVEPALASLPANEIVARVLPVLQRNQRSQDKLARTLAALKKDADEAVDAATRIAFYSRVIKVGGRGVLRDLVAEASRRAPQHLSSS